MSYVFSLNFSKNVNQSYIKNLTWPRKTIVSVSQNKVNVVKEHRCKIHFFVFNIKDVFNTSNRNVSKHLPKNKPQHHEQIIQSKNKPQHHEQVIQSKNKPQRHEQVIQSKNKPQHHEQIIQSKNKPQRSETILANPQGLNLRSRH